MTRRRRLFTPLAVILLVLVVGGLIVWGVSKGPSMFSPGGLNAQTKTQAAATAGSGSAASGGAAGQTAAGQTIALGGVNTHAALAGNCAACHAVPLSSATMEEKCLACHKNVQQQMDSHSGIHGKLLATGWNGTDCGAGCHTEHHGANGSLVVLDKRFPHDVTGYSLKAHQFLDCQPCHEQGVTTFDNKACADCHSSGENGAFLTQHTATFGTECVPCHDGVDRYGQDFDHSKTAFPLTGGHASVLCASCHKDITSAEALQNTPQDCDSCHAKDDAHAGKFGTDCAGCHNTTDWKQATFDHSKTSFPLTGAHADIACDKCHAGGKFQGTATDCVSCHAEPAFHAGAFGQQSTQCASCHTATAWTPAKFDVTHSFPLDHGSQEQTPTCKTCHPTTVTEYTCFGCHAHTPNNVVGQHEGRSLAELKDCAGCHQGGRGGD